MKAPASISAPKRLLRKKAAPAPLLSEVEVVAAKQQRFQEVFGGVDWKQARRTIDEAKDAAR